MADLWDEIAGGAAEESSLWADCLRADPDRTAVFSPLGAAEHELGLETIYEGYLVHYGRSRLFAPGDDDTALLLGDYLYAHGLVRIAAALLGKRALDAPFAALRLHSNAAPLDAAARTAAGDDAVEAALAAHAVRRVR